MNKPPSARILATIYACSERSIRNYRAAGAPLDDPAAMFSWWAARKNLPRGAAAKGLAAIQEAFGTVTGATAAPAAASEPAGAATGFGALNVPDDLPAGAEHELRWLGGLAVETRRNLIRAHKSGNALTQKQALDAYLKITEGLRKFDNQVATERRDAEEMVSRAQIESSVTAMAVWMRRGLESFLNSICLKLAEAERPQDVYGLIAPTVRVTLGNAVEAAVNDGKMPRWFLDAMGAGL